MSLAYVLYINLTIQLFAASVCMCGLHRLAGGFGCFLSEDHRPDSGEWRPDPLTQAITQIETAKKQGEGQDERIMALETTLAVLLAEFRLVRTIVFGMVGLVCTTALASVLVLIWKTKP